MKHFQLLCLYLLIPFLVFAPDVVKTEKQNTEQKVEPRQQKSTERRTESRQEKPIKEVAAQEQPSPRLAHEINPQTGHSDFEFALKDAYKNRQRNPAMTREESLKHARELYEKAKREQIKTKAFVLHLKDTYNSGGLSHYYGDGKHDEHSKELMKDLEAIDPYLAQKFRDSFVDTKQTTKTQSSITAENFIQWLEKNPDYIINPAKFTGKFHQKTPLEDAIELKDPTIIKSIIEIAKKHNISSEQLIAPIREEILDLLKTGGTDKVTEYINNIDALGVPELTKAVIKNSLRSILEWGLENNMEVAKEALEIALEKEVSLTFLTKPLVEKYNNMAKSAHKYLQKIYALGNEELSQLMYEQITATAKHS